MCIRDSLNTELWLSELEKTALIKLVNIEDISATERKPDKSFVIPIVEIGMEIYVRAEGIIDVEKEKGRLRKELEKAERDIASVEKRMSDADFLSKAPPSVVEATNIRFEDLRKKIERLNILIKEIEGLV
ncbi:MAG: hypothetical protein N3B13_06255, partial [Deltaproteobacteria bacterium]|nr:hypothetical protein [Deltaproteobacteria bacterium]